MNKGPLQEDLRLAGQQPEVPGKVLDYSYVPARGFLAGRVVKKGQVIRIIDTLGKQAADLVIWDAADLDQALNCCMTMMLNKKWRGWRPGDVLYSMQCQPMAIFGRDSTDGTHAALGAFCNEAYWHRLTGIHGCPNCRDNLVAAMADYHFQAGDLDWNSCITLFMAVDYQPDGSISGRPPGTGPGDFVDLVAMQDILVAASNCPGERSQSAWEPTPLQAVIFEPDSDYQKELAPYLAQAEPGKDTAASR